MGYFTIQRIYILKTKNAYFEPKGFLKRNNSYDKYFIIKF